MKQITFAGLHIGLAVLLLLPQISALAGNINLSPTRIQLSASRHSEVLSIHNRHTEPTVIQVEASAWRQDDTGDHYQPTRDLIATPSVFSLQPGENQLVRVGLRHPSSEGSEHAYRLFVQEVPKSDASSSTVQVILRFSLPVFVSPDIEPQPRPLIWHVLEYGNQLVIQATNPGAKHIQITGFTLYQEKNPIAVQQRMHYLFPGQTHQWEVRTSVPVLTGTTLTVDAITDAGDMQSTVLPPQ